MPTKRPTAAIAEGANKKAKAEASVGGYKRKSIADKMSSTLVEITVGEERKVYNIHLDVINAIPFFEKAFNSGLREGLNKEMVLKDVDPDVFDLAVVWLYRQGFNLPDIEKESSDQVKLVQWLRQCYCQLYILADSWTCSTLKEAVIRFLFDMDSKPGYQQYVYVWIDIAEVFEAAPVGCGLRRYLLRHAVEAAQSGLQETKKLATFVGGFLGGSEMVGKILDVIDEEVDMDRMLNQVLPCYPNFVRTLFKYSLSSGEFTHNPVTYSCVTDFLDGASTAKASQ